MSGDSGERHDVVTSVPGPDFGSLRMLGVRRDMDQAPGAGAWDEGRR
jgi:hypothetical protein